LAFESSEALEQSMLAALDAVAKAVAKKKKAIKNGSLRFVLIIEAKATDSLAPQPALGSLAPQPAAAAIEPNVSPGSAVGSPNKKRAVVTGKPDGQLDPKRLKRLLDNTTSVVSPPGGPEAGDRLVGT
jgi:hypothetical protein